MTQLWMWLCQSAGTRPTGPGVGCSSGWFSGGASGGPSAYCDVRKSQNQSSPGSKLRMIGWSVAAACARACCDGDVSQQPM
jgi:hypothetical protein